MFCCFVSVTKFNPPLLDVSLDLFPVGLAIVGIVGLRMMPVAVFVTFEFTSRWDHVVGRQLKLSFLQQLIDDSIGLCDVEP